MELESLKYIWHNLEATPVPGPDKKALMALLQKKSRGPVARMRRNLITECLFIVFTYVPAILFYWIGFKGKFSTIAWLFVGLLGLLAIYFYRKNRLLKKMLCIQCQVRSNLERQVRTLKKYVRFYLIAGTLLIPVMTLLSYRIIRLGTYPVAGYDPYKGGWVLLIPITIGIYFLNAWYVNKLYGRHIKKLQQLLQEMNEA